MKHNHHHAVCRRTGFTLVEMLVVIAIIAVLAVLSLTVVSRMRLAAAKSGSISNMRNMSIGIASWMADKSAPEPFYIANGSGDYPHESSRNGDFQPGNPARALYQKDDPSSGYIQDFNVFFSPLAEFTGTAPTPATYDPGQASESRLWGSYAYFFPHVTKGKITPRQTAMGIVPVAASRVSLDGKLMLTEHYNDEWKIPAKFGKRVYHVLLADWSVSHVADSDEALKKFKAGN